MVITDPLFQRDAYLRECPARVLEVLTEGVVLDRTVFYPQGGGQPGDTGLLRAPDGREWRVTDARKGEGGRVLHPLASELPPPAVGEPVEAVIDWDRRYAHMRMHSGLHLLGSVLRYGVTGGQISSEKSRPRLRHPGRNRPGAGDRGGQCVDRARLCRSGRAGSPTRNWTASRN